MQFRSVEEAYITLAEYVQAFIDKRRWNEAGCEMKVYENMAKASQWLVYEDVRDELGGFEAHPDAMWKGLDAAIFLRDDILSTTGERIWGLTFTLFPEGKFKIEYDYNQPEDYEYTDNLSSKPSSA